MPIYEYECKNCGHRLEQLQKMTDEPLLTCPECKKTQLVKLISNSSFQLKGTGWYVTDFKDKNSGTAGAKTTTNSPPKKKENKAPEKPKNVEKK
ncbi:MAG: zinc ribbon domain-containing protein [Gammaproteobacteria bacterium]|nr:zinc ribbon domain-containing protein [Gammaproteobacteria bacterium]